MGRGVVVPLAGEGSTRLATRRDWRKRLGDAAAGGGGGEVEPAEEEASSRRRRSRPAAEEASSRVGGGGVGGKCFRVGGGFHAGLGEL